MPGPGLTNLKAGAHMYIDVINGLLGAGKTTFLLNILQQKTSDEKVAVLVNEFGEIGIDGDLLSDKGADVVEMPNGCICCTLNADLRNQIRTIAENYHPDRLLIEPTGVATIKNLMSILRSLSLEKYIDDIRVIVVIDAGMFQEILSQNRGFVESQLEMAQIIIINKCDRVNKEELEQIQEFIRRVNTSGQVLLTTYGRVLDKDLHHQEYPGLPEQHDHHGDCHEQDHNGHQHGHGHEHELPLKNYEQYSRTITGTLDYGKLRRVFEQLKDGQFGSADRAKGIFRTSEKWLRIDLAAKEINELEMDQEFKSSKILVIGTQLKKDRINEELKKCLV